jgi:hypothetical protein
MTWHGYSGYIPRTWPEERMSTQPLLHTWPPKLELNDAPTWDSWVSLLYCDIDSGIPHSESRWSPKGENGELVKFGCGSYIEKFVSGGPKNYAFSVFCPSSGKRSTNCKGKCITLNYENSKFRNFIAFKSMILENDTPLHVHNPKKISTNMVA